ncbi:MAG: hypothetical protein AB1646_17840 [Thermodesulfobacteriota bacterium]
MTPKAASAREEVKSVWRRLPLHVAVCLTAFVVDAVVLHGFLAGFILFLAAVCWFLPAALFHLTFWLASVVHRSFNGGQLVRARVVVALVYVVTVGAILGVQAEINRLAEQHATLVIDAVDRFRAAHGCGPKSLHRLNPQYLKTIPLAAPTLAHNRFHYECLGCQLSPLSYWSDWPFYKRYCEIPFRGWKELGVQRGHPFLSLRYLTQVETNRLPERPNSTTRHVTVLRVPTPAFSHAFRRISLKGRTLCE